MTKKERKVYNFKKQLAKGKKSEKDFLKAFEVEDTISKISGRDGDFRINWSGQIVELKTDYYPDSPNIFLERWSVWHAKNDERNKPGGVWQSKGHEVSILAYWVRQPNELFLFDVEKLAKEFDEKSRSLILVPNQGYRSGGYKIPKEEARNWSSYLGSDLKYFTRFGD